jgi:hypothetical protein
MRPRRAAAPQAAQGRQGQPTQVTVALLYHVSDTDRARQLAGLLSTAGVTVVPSSAVDVDGVVVFLSAAGLAQPEWLDRATTAIRLVPVRVGQIHAGVVPERLRELNWIDWQPDNVRATFGYVLAGLLSDPARRDLSRQLSHEAEAWERSGRHGALLITDYRRARRMADVLRDLDADRLAVPSPAMRQFVARSVKVSRPRYRRRRMRLILGVAGTIFALATVAVTLPAIRLSADNNHEAIVTTGDPYMLENLPEWSAANAAALLADGTPAEQVLAEITLLRALNSPWEIDTLQWRLAPRSSAPFQHGTRVIVSVAAGLAVLNVTTQQMLWFAAVPGGPYYLSVDPEGETALGLSESGAVVIDLTRHSWRHVALGTRFADGKLGSDNIAVVRLDGAHLAELNTATGVVRGLGAYPSIISVAAKTPYGRPAALVRDRSGRVELIELPSRAVIASMPGNASSEIGTISPDGRHAVIEGGDGQFWAFGVGEPATPTGIAVPRVLSGVAWSTRDRLVVYSEDQRGQVYYLPRAEPIGVICRQDTRLYEVVPDYSSDVVACEGYGGTAFWRLPSGPLAHRVAGESTSRTKMAADVTVASSGPRIQIHGPGLRTNWFQPLGSDISAVDVADNGTRVVVGDTIGEVAVLDLRPGYATTVVAWVAPDHSPITAVGWNSGPIATTASGQTWRIADCADCATVGGLIRAYRARVTGCFTARQLRNIGSGMWAVLGMRECDTPFGQLGGN